MKIWKWYKKPTLAQIQESDHLHISDKYPLYAFTNNKKYRDLWRLTRKKECFIEKESKISKEDYINFTNQHNSELLDIYKYKKFDGYNNHTREPSFSDVEILTTWMEKEYTESMLESFSDSTSGYACQTYPNPPMIFIDKYFKALYDLQYVTLWRFFNENSSYFGSTDDYLDDMLERMGIEIDYAVPEYEHDEFAAFIKLHSIYLKL